MADDLVVTLGANVDNAVSNLKRSGSAVEEVGRKADAVDKQLKKINWGMIGSSLAIGFQDAASVVSMGGSMLQGLNAMGNNLIFAASMMNPILGGFTAMAVAATQIGGALMKTTDNMKELKKEAEKYKDVMKGIASANISAVGAAAGVKDQRQANKRIEEIDRQRKIAKAELDAANALVPKEKGDKEVKEELVKEARLKYAKLNLERDALSGAMKKLPVQYGLTDETKNLIDQTKELENNVAALKVPEGYLRDMKELETEMFSLRMDNRYSNETLKRYEDARRASINQAQAIREEAEAEKVHQKEIEKGLETQRNLDRMKSDALNERMKLDPTVRVREESKKLAQLVAHGGLSMEDMRKSLGRTVADVFVPGRSNSAALIRGSVDEVSARNQMESRDKNQQFIKSMVDKVIRALPTQVLIPTYGEGTT